MTTTKLQDVQIISITALNGLIEEPQAKEYTLTQRIPFGGLLTRLTAKSTNGSASGTLVLKVNGAAVTFSGGSFDISGTSEVTDTISSGGAIAEDDTIVLEVQSPSNLDDLSFSMEYERYGSR